MSALSIFSPGAPGQPEAEPTVQQIVDVYLRLGTVGHDPRAAADRKTILDDFCGRFGHVKVSEIKPFHATLWISEHPAWKSDWTVRRNLGTIKLPFGWAAKQGVIDRNPLAHLTHREGPRGKPMDDSACLKLLAAAQLPVRRAIEFLRATGARPVEIREMTWDQIDIHRSAVVQTKHKTQRSRKDGAPRMIFLNAEALRILREIRQEQVAAGDNQPHVFRSCTGKPWSRNGIQQNIARLRERLGIAPSVKLYGLRHRYATNTLKQGCDLATLAELLGHTTTKMTEHYLHLAGDTSHLKAAVDQFTQ